mmetsp:Transcript_21775/g.76443  ORF Transcript_21775/g.76443 Transcript_21775/m.76443 type:complete len:573 (-) Transcript_21775:639-2357(-)
MGVHIRSTFNRLDRVYQEPLPLAACWRHNRAERVCDRRLERGRHARAAHDHHDGELARARCQRRLQQQPRLGRLLLARKLHPDSASTRLRLAYTHEIRGGERVPDGRRRVNHRLAHHAVAPQRQRRAVLRPECGELLGTHRVARANDGECARRALLLGRATHVHRHVSRRSLRSRHVVDRRQLHALSAALSVVFIVDVGEAAVARRSADSNRAHLAGPTRGDGNCDYEQGNGDETDGTEQHAHHQRVGVPAQVVRGRGENAAAAVVFSLADARVQVVDGGVIGHRRRRRRSGRRRRRVAIRALRRTSILARRGRLGAGGVACLALRSAVARAAVAGLVERTCRRCDPDLVGRVVEHEVVAVHGVGTDHGLAVLVLVEAQAKGPVVPPHVDKDLVWRHDDIDGGSAAAELQRDRRECGDVLTAREGVAQVLILHINVLPDALAVLRAERADSVEEGAVVGRMNVGERGSRVDDCQVRAAQRRRARHNVLDLHIVERRRRRPHRHPLDGVLVQRGVEAANREHSAAVRKAQRKLVGRQAACGVQRRHERVRRPRHPHDAVRELRAEQVGRVRAL